MSCNPRIAPARARCRRISVSSIGTNELQLESQRELRDWLEQFQFPLSERMSCNELLRGEVERLQKISVSSIGTNELQPALRTPRSALTAQFQFPLSERMSCNNIICHGVIWRRRYFSFLYRNE